MPTKKSQSSTISKTKPRRPISRRLPDRGALPPYGVAIRNAIARGDAREMRQVATATRKWLREVQAALDKMEKSVSELEG